MPQDNSTVHSFDKPLSDKRRRELLSLIKVGAFPEFLLEGLESALRVRLQRFEEGKEPQSPLHCNAEWHFAGFTGPGSTLVPLVYGVAVHVAGPGGTWKFSVQELTAFFRRKRDDELYAGIHLLVLAGFFEVIEWKFGKPVMYRVVSHQQWAEKHPGHCQMKFEPWWHIDRDRFGAKLHAILGGERFFPEVLKGLRKIAGDATEDQIYDWAREFIEKDKGNDEGAGRRKRFLQFVRDRASAAREPK